jgi:hypothetical protein
MRTKIMECRECGKGIPVEVFSIGCNSKKQQGSSRRMRTTSKYGVLHNHTNCWICNDCNEELFNYILQ